MVITQLLGGITNIASRNAAGGIVTFVWLGAAAALVVSAVELLSVLSATHPLRC
ncbi:hypothetical protein ACFU93_12655 [Streptomyces sp. NPDC057611]